MNAVTAWNELQKNRVRDRNQLIIKKWEENELSPKPKSLRKFGADFNLSGERIRQILWKELKGGQKEGPSVQPTQI